MARLSHHDKEARPDQKSAEAGPARAGNTDLGTVPRGAGAVSVGAARSEIAVGPFLCEVHAPQRLVQFNLTNDPHSVGVDSYS
jgi:hypothetical protein